MPDRQIKLAAAIAVPDREAWTSGKRMPRDGSFTANVTGLAVGETACKAVQIDEGISTADIAANMASWQNELRNRVSPSVRDARSRSASEYTTEVTSHLTGKGRFFIMALVTRLA